LTVRRVGDDGLMESGSTATESSALDELQQLLVNSPIASAELGSNLGLYTHRMSLQRILFLAELYQHVIGVHGAIFELGVRWGQNLALLMNLRGALEPFNVSRRIVGFDTFAGFPSTAPEDGGVQAGAYAVTDGYEQHLGVVLDAHRRMSPLHQLDRVELVKGDAVQTVPAYLERHPETVVALAYFDFDIYEPTRACLEAIRPHLTQGSVVVFDELAHATFPGETIAVREVLGLDRYAIRHSSHDANAAYIIIDR
jgi:hypothetical protein